MKNQTIAACVREYRTAGSWAGVDKATTLDTPSKARLSAVSAAHVSKSSHAVAAIFRAQAPITFLTSAPPPPPAGGYSDLSKLELYALAKDRDLAVIYRMTKGEILAALEAADRGE